MFKSKLSKVIVSLLRRIAGVTRSGAKRLMRAMLQTLMAMGRRARLPVAGFVLPTVTMVLLVVILLTVAITLRSFDRANTARNVRVNQQVLAAATPALDRAKAKINFMLWEDPQRPTGTPSDRELYLRMANADGAATDLYNFGDEERLILKADLDGGGVNPASDANKPPILDNGTENELINTAWRYPVDTNGDGKFDTFTIYGIFFRSPKRSDEQATLGNFTRARRSLEARTPPTSAKGLNPECVQGGGTVATLVGDSGWYRIDGPLKKSFFVETVNVPITQKDIDNGLVLDKPSEAFKGSASTAALEYQQDQLRIPLANNAVVYEDDLDISPGPLFNLNGRIFTNSNLLVTNLNGGDRTRLYQVSSPDSCFYEQENSKIVVGGNVVNGWAGNTAGINPVSVHLFQQASSLPTGNGRNAAMLTAAKTISNDDSESTIAQTSLEVLYDNKAYSDRLSSLVNAQMGPPLAPNNEREPNPQPGDPFSVRNKPDTQTRSQALEEYFKQMLRKVPFAETANPPPTTPDPPIAGAQDQLRPALPTWIEPADGTTGIEVLPQLAAHKLETTPPTEDGSPLTEEKLLGDRVIAGNNLPAKRWKTDDNEFTSAPEEVPGKWNPTDTSGIPRTRTPQVTKLADVGATDRGGFWEGAAAETPKNPLDGVGGLRVITSAGVYERKNSFLPPPTWIDASTGDIKGGEANPNDTYDDPTTPGTAIEKYPVVWPDTMPMSPLGKGSKVFNNNSNSGTLGWVDYPSTPPPELSLATGSAIDPKTPQYAKGDLRMRATAVYHYKKDGGYVPPVAPNKPDLTSVRPFACVSSYYDPSNASTARNLAGLPDDVSGQNATLNPPELGTRGAQIGSNNGIVYGPPVDRTQDAKLTPDANGLLVGATPNDLQTQANYVFPDGRFANEPLRNALLKEPADRTLADKAAIDSTMCALGIIAATPLPVSSDIPPGAIQEVAFLNGREIKAIDRDDPNTIVNEAFTLSSPLTTGKANLTGNYNQPLEERQPLEIRATQINLDLLRKNSIAGEPLLPYSGIIYASRDDALPDRSDRTAGGTGIDKDESARKSPTDFLLDPTRKPSAILLVNGEKLARVPSLPPTVANVVLEKGLTLASNLPVYVKGNFNLHTQQEFKAPSQAEFKTTADWEKFYNRAKNDLNKNFACRPNDPRLSGKCTTGDEWRPANVLADAITLLSKNYRFGFRNEGDFDLRNNAGAAAVLPRRQQGFYNNNFVTNGLSSGAFSDNLNLLGTAGASTTRVTDATYVAASPLPRLWSSYFNNYVTPVQRRGNFPEYVMEVCTKLPVSACKDDDWYVDPQAPTRAPSTGTYVSPVTDPNTTFKAGSTVDPPVPALQRFPRRVAFKRNGTAPFDLTNLTTPEPLGISNTGTITAGVVGSTAKGNALWFAAKSGSSVAYDATNLPYPIINTSATTAITDGSKVRLPTIAATSTNPLLTITGSYDGSQPLLMPVPQLMSATTATPGTPRGNAAADTTGWIPKAVETTFNMVMGAGDTPSRRLGTTSSGDFNGGLQNLPRFLELWNIGTPPTSTNIQGSFIQLNRSAFNTAPYIPTLQATDYPPSADRLKTLFAQSSTPTGAPADLPGTNGEITKYNISGGQIPYFTPPTRNWGYDVGLLSQPPDLFTQKFTTPPSQRTPDEYFREVPRDDEWIKTLMCSKVAPGGSNADKNATESLTTADRAKCST
ncbi:MULTISPECIES: hormogonium polysaccharide biosynthesis protein HpsA [unclassified Microcoleus]|uniref:hormogonium polysaccharide biosynthesis protein HpsA n=1 Tax=unclassified Microcoleus TaxID=2642155 RepID=UPI002FD2FEF6